MKEIDYKIKLIKKEIDYYSKVYNSNCKKVLELKKKLKEISNK